MVDLVHKVQLAYNENLKLLQSKGMLPLFDAGYINMNRQYLTIGVNGLVEAAQFMGIEINDNPKYEAFVQEILGMIERYNRKYRTKDVLFNCEMIPAENVGVKHAKWDKEAGFQTFRECYNSYFYIVEDKSLNVVDKFRLHGRRYIKHLTGGSALHMNLEEHLSKEQYRQLLRVAAIEGCNYFTFNIPNTICNECKHIDKRYLHECPECHSRNVDYLTRVIGYMKRISNFLRQGRRRLHKDIMLRYVDYDIVFQEIPDEVTLAINLSNCPNRCKGCHSPHLLENVGESLTEESLGHLLQKYGKAVTCVCFMGGDAEPFEVERLAGFLHRQSIALVKVGWYSGKNELPEGLSVQNFEYIKLGPYIEKLGGLKSPDTNQHFYRIYGDEMKDITYRFWRI